MNEKKPQNLFVLQAIFQSPYSILDFCLMDVSSATLGVHSRRAARRNAETLIDKDIYDRIIEETKDDSGIIIGNDLPENAIIGTDPSFIPIDTPFSTSGNDEIIGTYRRERIIGNGADDRLEGGFGNDILNGGQDNDELDGGIGEDVAVFSDNFEDYEYEISESIFGG